MHKLISFCESLITIYFINPSGKLNYYLLANCDLFHQFLVPFLIGQFLRISGKRKRGQEDIQIIDANVDDYVDPNDLMKGISEESSYQPHRKKDNMPSTQQRRKKQITYLAFQVCQPHYCVTIVRTFFNRCTSPHPPHPPTHVCIQTVWLRTHTERHKQQC